MGYSFYGILKVHPAYCCHKIYTTRWRPNKKNGNRIIQVYSLLLLDILVVNSKFY